MFISIVALLLEELFSRFIRCKVEVATLAMKRYISIVSLLLEELFSHFIRSIR